MNRFEKFKQYKQWEKREDVWLAIYLCCFFSILALIQIDRYINIKNGES